MKTAFMNGSNYFQKENFDQMCKELERGMQVHVCIDCIGHTRNNMEQENYKKAFIEKYGDALIVEKCGPSHCYNYEYTLNLTN